MSAFDKRVQVNKIVESQLPEYITADFPKAVEFFKQYYISQEFQGGNIDIAENLDQYLKLDNLTPEVISGVTTVTSAITATSDVISVNSTKGFPAEWGLLKVDNEIITYTGITTNTFTGCVRGFTGVTGYNAGISSSITEVNKENLVFSSSTAAAHTANTTASNLSVLFLKEFYKKLKTALTPGLENNEFTTGLDANNFIKSARAFYQSKGIAESIRILFTVLYGKTANVLDLEERLIKPSSADFIRREIIVAEPLSGDPTQLVGQTVFKSTDSNTSGSVSEVEILTRQNKVYYQLSLFVGYNERDLIEGTFTIPGKSKILEPVSIGSSIISVDSTVGFGTTGTIISGNNTIDYTSKTVNQFFGCSGVSNTLSATDDIRSNEVIYGYEKGDLTKKVTLRITGVISDFVPTSDISLSSEKEIITVRNIGEVIRNPEQDRTYKEIFANSWIYNTSTRYQINTISGTAFTLLSIPEKSSLRSGDVIDILERNQQDIVASNVIIDSVVGNQIFVSNLNWNTSHPIPTNYYDLRRKLQKADSTGVSLEEGNDVIISDILNVYTDKTDGYVASNSLPSYTITNNIISATLPNAVGGTELQEFDNVTKLYNSISFQTPVDKFIDGDIVVYKCLSGSPIQNLVSGNEYYIVKTLTNRIQLYNSLGQLYNTNNNIQVGESIGSTHKFTLKRHSKELLSSNDILRKFPLSQTITSTKERTTTTDTVGILVNGVEISSPKSTEFVYYGPIDKLDVLNGGDGYDVINPPQITIGSPESGTDAQVELMMEGSVKQVYIDPQDFDIDNVESINITGGNGSGCTLEAIMGERFRELSFDSRDIFFGGGIDIVNETITFKKEHKLVNGEGIIYNQNGNEGLGIGPYGAGAGTAGIGSLSSGDKYYVRWVNPRTIQLYNTQSDALKEDAIRGNVGINTVGLSTATGASGIHKFRTVSKNTLRSVKVLTSGSGYQYKKLRVNPTGISTYYDSVTIKNHGFSEGDVVEYVSEGTSISGLVTTTQYKLIKIDSDSFRLSNAGVAGTDTTNYDKNSYAKFSNVGVGTHIFKYPDITVNVNVSYGQTATVINGLTVGPGIGTFAFTPIVTGKITGGQMYEIGSGYGSTITNLHRKPLVTLKNGKNAQLKPILVNGKIEDVQILSTGSEYYSTPTIRVTGSGSGSILRPVITGGKVTDIIVINTGIGYSTSNTNLIVEPAGVGAILEANVRPLQLNDATRFGDYSLMNNRNDLAYSVYGYSFELGETKGEFESLDGTHSEIIGWAYDGNPIYGPYGYETGGNNQSRVRILKSGYNLNHSQVIDRPSGFTAGFFIEDYHFNSSGDLDEHNGRFCKTPEFPNGVYAYFAGVSTDGMGVNLNGKQTFKSAYPYFVGNTYKSEFIPENFVLNHDFDFNNSNLSRNTFPYKVNEEFADNDFILESNEYLKQESVIESVNKGNVDSIEVLDGGSNYNIGDVVDFDDTDTNGTGLSAVVDELVGIGVSRIDTEVQSWEGSTFVWENEREISAYIKPYVDIQDEDTVIVSGLSTAVTYLQDQFKVGVTSSVVSLAQSMSQSPSSSGMVTDIYLNEIPNSVSVGGSFKVGTETLRVLNIYPLGSILRARRFGVGIAHTYGSEVSFLNDKITLNVKTPKFDSQVDKKIFFNGHQAVGVGTTAGAGINTSFRIGESFKNTFIPTRTIYVPDHPFVTGEKLTLTKPDTANPLVVGIHSTGTTFNLPNNNTDTDDVYVINKSKNHIGLSTGVVNGALVGVGGTSEGLYFYTTGDDDSVYSLETNYRKVTGRVDRVVTTVTTTVAAGSTAVHGLKNRDTIKLNVQPNLAVGIGTTAACSVHFDVEDQKLLLNPISITFSATSTIDIFTYNDHRFNTGDKIWYETISGNTPVGLTNRSSYYVHRLTDNTFKLAPTWDDARLGTNIASFVTAPTSVNVLSLINPPIQVVRNSNLKFGLSTSTLSGFSLKIFHDKDFKNEFNSVGAGITFNVVGFGTVGVADDASLTLNYHKDIPSKLYYALEKGGYISTADTDVKNYSEITFADSEYNGEYKVFNVGVTTFQISPRSLPGVSTYFAEDCDKMEYTTKAAKAVGSIKDLRILSKGFNYKKLPKFVSVGSTTGKDANLVAISTSIGRIKEVRIKDIGYEYPSDKTLRPEAYVSPVIRIDDLDTVASVDIIDGGKNYVNPPDLILYNPNTKETVDSTSLVPYVPNSTVADVEVLAPITGLESISHEVIALNNSNGVGISTIYGGGEGGFAGVVTCVLDTPVLGFSSAPFAVGDEIFVEGIELYDSTSPLFGGSGYNSDNYDYNFYKVTAFSMNNPSELEFRLAGFTTNPGVAKTFQSGYATITNRKLYPRFKVNQTRGSFNVGEQLYVDTGTGYFEQDVYVAESREDFIKITGSFELFKGYTVRGKNSGVVASVITVINNKAKFKIDYANRQNYGWVDNVGKLSEDFQVTPDNDYFQNLSYSIQSPITWDKFVDPVNRVVHPLGLKNFADTAITTNVNVGVSYGATTNDVVILDVYGEKRVDTINTFDEVLDYDIREGKSKYLQLQNTKLTDYNKCLTNRVLLHDDISEKFSSKGTQDLFTEIEEITDNHARYLIQVVDPDTNDAQINDLIVSTTTDNAILFERSDLYTNIKLGEYTADADTFQRKALRFNPTEKYVKDHDIKVLKTVFNTDIEKTGTTTIGSINLTGKNVGIGSTTTGTVTQTIAEFSPSSSVGFNGLFANIQIQDKITRELNYLDVLVDYDGTNVSVGDYYFNNNAQTSSSRIGLVTAIYDANAGIVSLTCENDRDTALNLRANIVGFGTTTVGLSTYRFAVPGQPVGAERSGRLESIYNAGTSTPIEVYRGNLTNDTALKSVVRVSCGDTSALHQVHLIQDKTNAYTTQLPFIANGIGATTGIGTFGALLSGGNAILNFYPDSAFTSTIEVQSYNEVLYTVNDFKNEPPALEYGSVTQSMFLSSYDGINGNRANKTDFDLLHETVPIYTKTFNPGDATQLDPATGIFTIKDHFFNTGEKLTYEPKSTFIGVGQTGVGIGQTESYLGVQTSVLPPVVYPVVINADQFRLVTRKEYASTAGTHVVFTNTGEGNAHEFEMTKKLTKTVIGLDGIVQQPITYTTINHALEGAIPAVNIETGVGKTFAMTGISTVQPRDVIKVGDEYMKVIEVGFSTQRTGPIRVIAGAASTFSVVSVERGALGTASTSHLHNSRVDVYRGSFNIVGSKVHFLDPPKGNTRQRRSETNLPYVKAEFSGRTFLRSDYSTNMLFDDISDDFTGIGKTYTVTVGGANTTGVSVGNGILFINGVFQTPITENNGGNNYAFEDDTVSGISSAVFTGITSTDGSFIKSDFDINQNQLPRGGLIVSLGSTAGLGYAPLVGAKVLPKMNASGTITSIVGVGTTGNSIAISTAYYDNESGIIELTTSGEHKIHEGDMVKLSGLNFTCQYGSKTYPFAGITGFLDKQLDVVGILSTTTLNVKVGTSTVTHVYQGQVSAGTTAPHLIPYYDLTFGSGYRGPVAIGVTDLVYEHKFVSASTGAVTGTGGPFTPTNAKYDSHTGVLQLTIPAHGRTSGNVQLVNNSLTFTCARDNHSTQHTYPRSTDPAANGNNLTITVIDVDTISVDVGSGGAGGTGANITAQSAANDHTFVAGSSSLTNAVDITGGGTLTPTSATYTPLTGEFVITKSSHGITGATAITPTAATYAKTTGMLTLTKNGHGFSVGDMVLVADNSLTFTCSKDNNTSQHHYPRESDPISGKWVAIASKTTNTFKIDVGKALNAVDMYDHTFVSAATNCILKSNAKVTLTANAFAFTCAQDNHATTHTYPRTSDPAYKTELPVGSATADTFNVIVGKSAAGTGGVLKFNIVSGGTGYINPSIEIPQPVYENVPVRGVSRLSIGNTTDTGNNLLLNLRIDQHPLELVGDRFGDAARLIKDNAQLIGEVAVGRMLDEYPSFQVASGAAGYNNQDCIDDIKDVLDSVNWNLQYGGNDRTVDTANLYVTDDHLLGEEQESIYAFKQAARLSVDVMRNKTVTVGAQHKHRFVSATSTAVDPSTGSAFQPTGASYDPATGDLVVTKSSHGLTPPAAHTAKTGTSYEPSTGLLTVETTANHGLSTGDKILIKDESLTFTCARDSHATQHSYPRATDPYSKKWLQVTVNSATQFTCNVGVSQDTSAHTFVYADPNGILELTSTVLLPDGGFTFTCDLDDYQSPRVYPRPSDPASSVQLGVSTTSSTTFTVNVGASQTTYLTTNGLSQKYDGAITVDGSSYTPTSAAYESSTGILTLTLNNHGFSTGESIKIVDNSIIFTCDMDGNATQHTYPRPGDPASNNYLSIGSTTNNTFEVNVGKAPTKNYTPSAVTYNPTTGIMEMTIGNHCYETSSTLDPTWAEYDPNTGYMTITVANHGLCNGNRIKLADNAVKFACNFGGATGVDAQKSYPRSTDPISGKWVAVQNVTTNKFDIQVLDKIPSTNVRPHTFTSIVANSITKQGNLVRIAPNSLNFTCAQDSHETVHSYPRVGDPAYNNSIEITAITATTISVQVLSTQPSTNITAHTFVGADTDSITLGHYDHTFVSADANCIQKQSVAACANVASAIHTLVGIVTTGIGHTTLPPRNPADASLFGVRYFEKARDGHSFDIGDKFEPVGLVTAKGLRKPRVPFELEVVQTFNDYFSAWQFGQVDFIDPIKFMQNGARRRFPLRYNGELLSFEVDKSDSLSSQIDLNSVLLVFVNGVLQIPNVSYQFEGGATFTFTEAPDSSDQVDVFFYVGESGVDSIKVTVLETLKKGDDVRVFKHPIHPLTKDQLRSRVIMDIAGSDILETDTYVGQGITETTYKPIEWNKQKADLVIKGDVVSKGRENIKAAVYPTAHIIQDVSPTSTSIFVDNAQFFHYEFNDYNISAVDIGALVIPNNEPVSAAFTAIVSAAGTISSFDVTNVGAGYSVASIPVTVGIPTYIGVGIGTTATGTATITNGSVSSIQVTNPGLGYTRSNPPLALAEIPAINPELIKEISNVQGFSGIITGIGTTTNGNQLALNFFFRSDSSDANDLTNTFNQENVSVVISGTKVGTGVTSVDTGGNNAVVGIGTTGLDCVYRVHNITNVGPLGLITCNVHNDTDVSWASPPVEVGIATIALNMSGINTTGLGKLSWGRIYNYTRGNNPISIGITGLTYGQPNPDPTEDQVGLSTYPTVQRRLFGARNSGGIRNLSA